MFNFTELNTQLIFAFMLGLVFPLISPNTKPNLCLIIFMYAFIVPIVSVYINVIIFLIFMCILILVKTDDVINEYTTQISFENASLIFLCIASVFALAKIITLAEYKPDIACVHKYEKLALASMLISIIMFGCTFQL